MRTILLAGLDVGSTTTRAVIGQLVRDFNRPELRILGVGSTPTAGVRKDVITDLDGATNSIRTAVQEAELMAGMRVDRVYVGISGDHVNVKRSVGVVAVSDSEIVPGDVDRVHEVAQAVPLPRDRELLHAIPQDYQVDHQRGIKAPVGMPGTRLETDLMLVTGCATVVGNVARAVERAGYRVQDTVIEPLAAARSVVPEDEKELGVAMVDVGSATTGLAIYYEGRLCDLEVLPLGGSMVTSDLIRGLSIPFADASRLKEDHGAAHAGMVDPTELVQLPGSNGHDRKVARRFVAGLMEERFRNMLLLISRKLNGFFSPEALSAGVVITGGVAMTPGLVELARRCLGTPVRVGAPREGLSGLLDVVGAPGFSTATGLVLHGADYFMDTGEGASTMASGVVTRMGAWLKEFF